MTPALSSSRPIAHAAGDGFPLVKQSVGFHENTEFSLARVKTMRSGENSGLAVLVNALPPRLDFRIENGDVLVSRAATRTVLRPIWAGQGFPADIRAVVSETQSVAGAVPVVTGRRMSPRAQDLLAEHHLSWADAAGYADITDGAALHIARLQPIPLGKEAPGEITWSRSADAIAEFILARRLEHPGLSNARGAGVDRLSYIAERTNLSTAQAAKILALFDDAGYTTKFGPERGPTSTRDFTAPGRLLSDWAGHYARTAGRGAHAELHTTSRDPGAWLALLDRGLHTMPWAISGWLAADDIAHFATSVPDITVYVDEDAFSHALLSLTSEPDVTEVERAGRIRLRTAPRHVFTFVRRIGGRPLVSPIRIYADLLRSRGRGQDAADHLREIAIGF